VFLVSLSWLLWAGLFLVSPVGIFLGFCVRFCLVPRLGFLMGFYFGSFVFRVGFWRWVSFWVACGGGFLAECFVSVAGVWVFLLLLLSFAITIATLANIASIATIATIN
jgi:hypothetical protein